MRLITYTDPDGWKRRSLIKENMLDEQASQGIPRNPPDISQLDWDSIPRELNNLLVDRELFTVGDLNQVPQALRNVILAVLYKPLLELYKNHHQSGLNGGRAPAVKSRPKEALHDKSSL